MLFRLFFLFLFTFSGLAIAQDSRWIDMEWEEVPEAKGYELELFQEEEGKKLSRGKFKTEFPSWSHAVPPGKYSLRIRSLDRRGVPGEWSDYIPLKVRMQNPQQLRPVPGDKMDQAQVTFEWSEVPGAHHYQLVVKRDTEIIHNATTPELKASVYVDQLGTYDWAVFALEAGESLRRPEDWSGAAFKSFTRVGGELEAPVAAISLGPKVNFHWSKVRSAQYYEVDYLPPPESGDKNRRFKLKRNSLAFASRRLKEGTTTLTVKAIAPGYQDSAKSIAMISKSADKVELADLIQGQKERGFKTDPTLTPWRNQIFLSIALARFDYESRNTEDDTTLDQETLIGLGLNFEWAYRPRLNALVRWFDASVWNLSSGLENGLASRVGYTFSKLHPWKNRHFYYGGGASLLGLPAFMGKRIEDEVNVEHSLSLGPEVVLGYIHPLSRQWIVHTDLTYAYHLLYLSSAREGEEGFSWIRGQIRCLRYFNENQALFAGAEYRTWNQGWSEDYSKLSGIALNLGWKTGF